MAKVSFVDDLKEAPVAKAATPKKVTAKPAAAKKPAPRAKKAEAGATS
jgi:hypothetical protein